MKAGTRKGQRVLVTGARLPAALEIIKAINAEGAEVWAADSLCITPASISRHVTGYLRIPSPVFSYSEFRNCIVDIVNKFKFDLIVPVSEEIFFLAQINEELLPAILVAPPVHLLRRLHSKLDVLDMAKECGIRVPHTLKATSSGELFKALEQIPDGIVKPEYSRGAYEIKFPPHQDITLGEVSEFRPLLVQERLEGREISTYCVAFNGCVLAQSVYEPLYRVGKGASLYFRPIDSSAADSFVAEFVRKHSLSGQLSFDIMEERDGSIALIECNPRATSGVHLLALENHWGGVFWGDRLSNGQKRTRPCAAKLAVMFLHTLPAIRERRVRKFISDIVVARDSIFSARDPLPILGSYLCLLEIMWRSRSWSAKGVRAFTHDIEWNG